MTTHDQIAPRTRLDEIAAKSLELIVSLQDSSGAYPASPTFSAYRGYSWFRDGAFIADAASAAGAIESASRFFDWCSRILLDRSAYIEDVVNAVGAGNPLPDERMLATRFTFDGREGTDDWWDFQLDGYGTWLWAVTVHAERHGLTLDRWEPAIRLSAEYLVSSWNRPCFDWWEEHNEHVHVSTLGCVAAGLRAAARAGVLESSRREVVDAAVIAILRVIYSEGVVDGHLTKWLGSVHVDASLLALIAPLGLFEPEDPIAIATTKAIVDTLTVDRGVHRFLGDTFYGGGQWPLLSCLLGLVRHGAGDARGALAQLEWAFSTATSAGELPEQVDLHLLDPATRQEWQDRWGDVATPLVWSHAMYLRLAVQLGFRTEAAL